MDDKTIAENSFLAVSLGHLTPEESSYKPGFIDWFRTYVNFNLCWANTWA